jgi:hypothetical protein
MPRPVAHITAPIEPLESQIKRLRIPKARQKELLAIMDEAWERLVVDRIKRPIVSAHRGEKLESASATR